MNRGTPEQPAVATASGAEAVAPVPATEWDTTKYQRVEPVRSFSYISTLRGDYEVEFDPSTGQYYPETARLIDRTTDNHPMTPNESIVAPQPLEPLYAEFSDSHFNLRGGSAADKHRAATAYAYFLTPIVNTHIEIDKTSVQQTYQAKARLAGPYPCGDEQPNPSLHDRQALNAAPDNDIPFLDVKSEFDVLRDEVPEPRGKRERKPHPLRRKTITFVTAVALWSTPVTYGTETLGHDLSTTFTSWNGIRHFKQNITYHSDNPFVGWESIGKLMSGN